MKEKMTNIRLLLGEVYTKIGPGFCGVLMNSRNDFYFYTV